MNATEQWYYENHLLGKYSKVMYERVKFVLYPSNPETKSREATYLPDFWCLDDNGEIHIHETKGFCDEADRLKVKMAASLFPEVRWFLVQVGYKKKQFLITKTEEF